VYDDGDGSVGERTVHGARRSGPPLSRAIERGFAGDRAARPAASVDCVWGAGVRRRPRVGVARRKMLPLDLLLRCVCQAMPPRP
jgi:hypothetical protein